MSLILIGIVAQQRGAAAPVGNAPTITSITVNKVSNDYTASFVYNDIESDVESSIAPLVNSITITGSLIVNELQSIAYSYFSNLGIAEGASIKKWYQANDAIGTGEVLVATAATYTPLDDTKFIRVGITPVDALGKVGIERFSNYYDVAASFDPFVDISWLVAARPTGAANLAVSELWENEGTGVDLARNATDAFPTYNGTQVAAEFTRASSQELTLPIPVKPCEVWVRVKPKVANQFMQLVGLSGTHSIRLTSSGGINASGVATGFTYVANNWMVLRFVLTTDGLVSKFNKNDGTEVSLTLSGAAISGTGRVGANNAGNSDWLDGYMSHIFVKSGAVLSDTEKLNMWNWFIANANWD